MLGGNSGRDLTSRFRVLRQRLKKPADLGKPVSQGVNFGSVSRDRFFQPKDLMLGTVVPIFGRPVFIASCDAFTRAYFADVLGAPQPANSTGVPSSPSAAAGSAAKAKVKGGRNAKFEFMDPTNKVMRLERAIREKLEVASNFGTNDDQRRHLQAMFHAFDRDGSGVVSQVEFKEAMQGFSMFGADVDLLFVKYDKDRSGSLAISEFADMLYNNPSAMRFSMDTGRGSRSALNAPPSPARGAGTDGAEVTAADAMHQKVQRTAQNQQMLCLLEQNLRDKAESLSNFSSSDQVQQRQLARMFKRFDANGNGTLSRAEFRAALMAMHFPVQDADLLFDAYDVDENGSLSYDEFCGVLLKRRLAREPRKFLGTNSCVG